VVVLLTAVAAVSEAVAAASTEGPQARQVPLSGAEAPRSPNCSPRFCVHWTAEGEDAPPTHDADGDAIPDYVAQVSAFAEDSLSSQTAAGSNGLGWAPPVPDGERGGEVNKTDVYVDFRSDGEAGYAYFDPGQDHRRSAWLAVSNHLRGATLQRVVTHELNHVLQFGTDAYQQGWMFEATASWVEHQLHQGTAQGAAEVGRWAAETEAPLTGASTKRYGSRVWNAWLASRYGVQVVAEAWRRSPEADPRQLSAPAYEAAIGRAGGFAEEFARFAAATSEWRRPGGPWADAASFPDVERVGSLDAGGASQTLSLDHTTFALLDVPIPRSGGVELRIKGPGGVAAAAALVGRTGSAQDGATTTQLIDLPAGGPGSVRLEDAARYARLTAVVVNADATAESGTGSRALWRDDQPFSAKLVAAPGAAILEPGLPVGASGAAPTPATAAVAQGPALKSPWVVRLSAPGRILRATFLSRGLGLTLRSDRQGRSVCRVSVGGRQIARRSIALRAGLTRVRLRPTRNGRRLLGRRMAGRMSVSCAAATGAERRRLQRGVVLR